MPKRRKSKRLHDKASPKRSPPHPFDFCWDALLHILSFLTFENVNLLQGVTYRAQKPCSTALSRFEELSVHVDNVFAVAKHCHRLNRIKIPTFLCSRRVKKYVLPALTQIISRNKNYLKDVSLGRMSGPDALKFLQILTSASPKLIRFDHQLGISVASMLQQCGRHLKVLRTRTPQPFEIQLCTHLEELNMKGGAPNRDLITTLGKQCPKLRKLILEHDPQPLSDLTCIPSLTSLDVRIDRRFDILQLSELCRDNRNLIELKFPLPGRTRIDIAGWDRATVAENFRNVRKLVTYGHSSDIEGLEFLFFCVHQVEELDISISARLYRALANLSNSGFVFQKLSVLDFYCIGVANNNTGELVGRLAPNLKKLSIYATFKGNQLSDLGSRLTQLENLHFSIKDGTPNTIMNLLTDVSLFPRLKELFIHKGKLEFTAEMKTSCAKFREARPKCSLYI